MTDIHAIDPDTGLTLEEIRMRLVASSASYAAGHYTELKTDADWKAFSDGIATRSRAIVAELKRDRAR